MAIRQLHRGLLEKWMRLLPRLLAVQDGADHSLLPQPEAALKAGDAGDGLTDPPSERFEVMMNVRH